MTNQDYDWVVIGSGPAGQKAAINAARLEKQVAVIRAQAWLAECPSTVARFPARLRGMQFFT